MKDCAASVLCLLLLACPPPKPKPQPAPISEPRDEQFPSTIVDFRGVQRVVVTRTAQPGEALPRAGNVNAWLLDRGNVRIDAAVRLSLGTTSTAEVEFTPPDKRPLDLVVDWGNEVGITQRAVDIVELLDATADFELTYVDRMDLCVGGPLRGASGRVFCQRGKTTWVYDTSGNVAEQFPGFDLMVSGSEVWSGNSNGYEHRSDLASSLRYDGLVPMQPAWPFGEIRAGRALRGTADGFLELTWDGTTLSSRALSGYPGLEIDGSTAFLDGDRITLTEPLCTLTRGCTQTSCPPVRTCVAGEPSALGLTDRFVWSFSSDEAHVFATLRQRDRIDLELRRVRVPLGGFTTRFKPLDRMTRRLTFEHVGGSSIPVGDENEAWAQVWPHAGALVSATDEWLIASPSEYRLRFHRRQ